MSVVDLAGTCTGPGPCVTTPLGTSTKPWIAKVGGLPLYIRAIAQALLRSGHSESSAIATAVATVKRWAAGGGKVTPATRARAAAAVAEWESKKAASHALTAEATVPIDLATSKPNPAAAAETELIRRNRETPAGKAPHKFQPANWTHPNGHPRCKLCGTEESMSGMCEGSAKDGLATSSPGSKGVMTANLSMPVDLAMSVASAADGPQMTMTVGQHMAALRKLAVAHKRAGPSQRPKIRAKMAEHAQAIGAAKAKNLTADTTQPLDLAGAWDPSQHPRVAGKFAPKGTQTQGAQPKPGSPAPAALPPAMAAQIADFQRRNGLPVTGTFTPATVAAMQPKTGGGKGKGKGGAAKKAAKGAASKQHAAVKAYLKARQSAAKKAAAQAKKAQTPAGKATTAKAATMAAAAKSPAVRVYLKAGAAARAQQLASAKASTAPKAAVKASNAKATAAVAGRLAHH